MEDGVAARGVPRAVSTSASAGSASRRLQVVGDRRRRRAVVGGVPAPVGLRTLDLREAGRPHPAFGGEPGDVLDVAPRPHAARPPRPEADRVVRLVDPAGSGRRSTRSTGRGRSPPPSSPRAYPVSFLASFSQMPSHAAWCSSSQASRSAPEANASSGRSGGGVTRRIVPRPPPVSPARPALRGARAGAPRGPGSWASGRAAPAGRGGTVVRTSATQSSSGSSPEMSRASPVVTGASTPARSSARASSGTRSSDSTACPIRSGISAAGTPWASSSPARRLRLPGRERGRDEVARPAPARSATPAARRAPRRSATPRRRCGRRRRRRRSGPGPRSRRWPSAAAFFAAPASSTPIGSLDSSQTTPARLKVSAIACASSSLADAATRPAPSSTISRACAGPPTTAMRCAPKRLRRCQDGAWPSGGTRPLASEMTDARGRARARGGAVMTSSRPREGTPRNTRSDFARPALAASMRRSAGSRDARAGSRGSRGRRAGARPAPRCASAASCAARRGRAGRRRRCRTSRRRRRRRGARPGGRRRGVRGRPRGELPVRRAAVSCGAAPRAPPCAALWPGIPLTPPPRRAPAPHSQTFAGRSRRPSVPASRVVLGERPLQVAVEDVAAGQRRARARGRAGVFASMHGTPSGVAQQAVLDRLGEDACRASASVAADARGPCARVVVARRTAARAVCSPNSVSVWAPRGAQLGAEDRRVGQRVAVDLAAAGRRGSRPAGGLRVGGARAGRSAR